VYGTASSVVGVRSAGTLAWTCPLSSTLLSDIAIGQGGIVYLVTTTGLVAVSSATGAVLWTFSAPAPAPASPSTLALMSTGEAVFTTPCCVFAVDGQSGGQLWRTPLPAGPPLALAVAAGDVVLYGLPVVNGGGFEVGALAGTAPVVSCAYQSAIPRTTIHTLEANTHTHRTATHLLTLVEANTHTSAHAYTLQFHVKFLDTAVRHCTCMWPGSRRLGVCSLERQRGLVLASRGLCCHHHWCQQTGGTGGRRVLVRCGRCAS
jgi:hypothetical protein